MNFYSICLNISQSDAPEFFCPSVCQVSFGPDLIMCMFLSVLETRMENCVAKADEQKNITFHKHVFTCNRSVVSNPKKEHISI